MDHMPEIIDIVRTAISDGLIRSETVEHFDDACKTLKGNALEDYIQTVWDKI